MKAVIQRVSQASVKINNEIVAQIQKGLLVLIGIEEADNQEDIYWLTAKIANLRIFGDEEGKMNRSLQDLDGNGLQGGLLVVSQFTLAADTSSGTRPSFTSAAPADEGRRLYDAFVAQAKAQHPQVQTGIFGADMKVHLVNDGPVTIQIKIIGA